MRIVVTAQPAYSHLVPLVLPVGRLLQRAGHEVLVATAPAAAEDVQRAGLRALVLPNVLTIGEVIRDRALAEESGMAEVLSKPLGTTTMPVSPQMFARYFIGVLGGRFGENLVEAAEGRVPDLVLREATEYGGYFAAERWGRPHATLDIAPMIPHKDPTVLAELNTQRRNFGSPPVSDPWHPLRTLRAGVLPEAFYPPSDRLPHARYYRPPSRADLPALDPTIAELPDDRPLVLANLGSVAPMILGEKPHLLDMMIEALGGLAVTAVVALGAGRDPGQWRGARAQNVHLTSFVQQSTLLPACALFVTHCGFNSTVEALAAGVPMVGLPMFGDQPANADRIVELGAGVRLAIEDVTPGALRAAIRRVLDEPVFQARARGMQRRILALPPLEQLVHDLAALER